MASLITLCNQALSEIAKDIIADLDEGSLEARECRRFAEPLLAEMADWTEWHQLETRAALTPSPGDNDRPAEWLYSYVAPQDMAFPVAIRAVEDAASSLPLAGPHSFPMQDGEALRFYQAGGNIYSNVESATLVYQRNAFEADDLTPLMQRAFVLELASRIAGTLAKDAKTVEQKGRQAEIARQRAVADEENKNQRMDRRYISHAEYARHGIGV